jgi:hypothetical protein
VNSEIESIRLDRLRGMQENNNELVANQLAEIQILLISRISVEPGSYDSYFHLAGTSLLLAKKSIKTQDGKSVSA